RQTEFDSQGPFFSVGNDLWFHCSKLLLRGSGRAWWRREVRGLVAQTETEIVQGIGSDYLAKYGFANPDEAEAYFFKSSRGLSHELVDAISSHKNEPDWMRKFRHDSLDNFLARPLPSWGGDVSGIDF